MNDRREYPGVIVFDNFLYIFGGEIRKKECYYPRVYSISNTTECISVDLETRKEYAPMLHPVSDMGVRLIKNIYCHFSKLSR